MRGGPSTRPKVCEFCQVKDELAAGDLPRVFQNLILRPGGAQDNQPGMSESEPPELDNGEKSPGRGETILSSALQSSLLSWIPKLDCFIRLNRLDGVDLTYRERFWSYFVHMPATEKMRTENTESSFSVFSVCILQWPALSVVASNFGIEVYSDQNPG